MSSQYPQPGWQPNPYEHTTPPHGYGPQAPMPMPPPPYGYGYQPQQPKNSTNAVLITVIVGAIVLAFIVFVAPLIFINNMSSEVDEMISNSSGGNTEKILDDEIDVTFGTFTKDTEYTSLTRGKLPVTVHNKGSERATYNIQIEAVDADGNRIAEDTAYIRNLGPGQSSTQEAFTLSDDYYKLKGATFKVAGVTKY
jgi:hypothetical protein